MCTKIDKNSDPLSGILKLQLRKPKNWKWELTTSKSSPNISIPIIELFDHKGNLLTKADDPNGCCRRSWHEEEISRGKQKLHLSFSNKDFIPKETFSEKNIGQGIKGSELNKKYKLRSSKAGTLVVSDDSFEERPKKHRSRLLIKNDLNDPGNFYNENNSLNKEANTCQQNYFRKPKNIEALKQMEPGFEKFNLYPLQDYRIFKRQYRNSFNNNPISRKNFNFAENLNEISQLDDIYFNNNLLENNDFNDNLHSKSESNIYKFLNRSNRTRRKVESFQNCCRSELFKDKTQLENNHYDNQMNNRKKVKRKMNSNGNSVNNSSSSSTHRINIEPDTSKEENFRRKHKGDRILEIDKKPVSDLESATKQLQSASDKILFRLVRRLASVNSHETKDPSLATTEQLPSSVENNLKNKMGANVSRHSGKGLTGRRTQSSGNICNGKSPATQAPIPSTNVTKFLSSCATTDTASTPTTNTIVNKTNGQRFSGSLPNNLDDTDSIYETDSIKNCTTTTKENNNHVGAVKVAPPHVPKKYQAPPIPTLPKRSSNNNVEIQFQPLYVKTSDTGLCDQGYGSERSPEEEQGPAIPSGSESGADDSDLYSKYPFITPESTFTVTLTKNSRGLGLSVTGGIDSEGHWPGLVRVKRLFPNQPAAMCGHLAIGDLILAANGLTLIGLTNYEALEVLRTTPTNVVLTVCRLPPEILGTTSPLSDIPPPPPKRDPPCSLNLLPALTPYEDAYSGEFDIVLTKVQGSLGFTLRKEDESALGHYVRALVREPALSDGRIKAGDKIIAVNDVELSAFSHEEAVQFLRQCGQEVKLRLYRDSAQTPVAALSPTEPDAPLKLKPLRQEAIDMLSDLAVRKLSPDHNQSMQDSSLREPWQATSPPRRLRRLQKTTPESDGDGSLYSDDKGSYKYGSNQLNSESDSFSRKASIGSDNNTNLSSNESECDKPIRPNFLNLCPPITTPTSRKPKFQFSLAHNAYELNNLDADILDAPNLTFLTSKIQDKVSDVDEVDGGHANPINDSDEPVSMPPMSTKSVFTYNNPTYQSAHPKINASSINIEANQTSPTDSGVNSGGGSRSLLKWKGVLFNPDSTDSTEDGNTHTKILHTEESDFEIITIELNRGWNSRLGFSLQQGNNNETYVSAVHSDSVAAKDGRLKAGDILLRVNDENIESMTTNNVIDLLRIVRGPVCIVVARKIE